MESSMKLITDSSKKVNMRGNFRWADGSESLLDIESGNDDKLTDTSEGDISESDTIDVETDTQRRSQEPQEPHRPQGPYILSAFDPGYQPPFDIDGQDIAGGPLSMTLGPMPIDLLFNSFLVQDDEAADLGQDKTNFQDFDITPLLKLYHGQPAGYSSQLPSAAAFNAVATGRASPYKHKPQPDSEQYAESDGTGHMMDTINGVNQARASPNVPDAVFPSTKSGAGVMPVGIHWGPQYDDDWYRDHSEHETFNQGFPDIMARIEQPNEMAAHHAPSINVGVFSQDADSQTVDDDDAMEAASIIEVDSFENFEDDKTAVASEETKDDDSHLAIHLIKMTTPRPHEMFLFSSYPDSYMCAFCSYSLCFHGIMDQRVLLSEEETNPDYVGQWGQVDVYKARICYECKGKKLDIIEHNIKHTFTCSANVKGQHCMVCSAGDLCGNHVCDGKDGCGLRLCDICHNDIISTPIGCDLNKLILSWGADLNALRNDAFLLRRDGGGFDRN